MKVEKQLSKFNKTLTSLEKRLENPAKQLISFVKQHKKLIVTLGVGYLVWKFLFDEEEEEHGVRRRKKEEEEED